MSDTQFIDKHIYDIICYSGKLKYFIDIIYLYRYIILFGIYKALESKYCNDSNAQFFLNRYLI